MPMKMVLKKMSQLAQPSSLRYHIHKTLSDFDARRSHHIIHASELTKDDGICCREYALLDVLGDDVVLPDRDKSASEEVTWEFGRMIQERVVHWFADAGIALSDWECRGCGKMEGICKRPRQCEECGSSAYRAVEPRFISKKSGASCGIDLFVQFGTGPIKIVEIKTIDPKEFKELKMPLQEHRLRTNLYMRIVEESDDPFRFEVDTKEAIVFYVSKGGYGCADPDLRRWGLSEYFSPFKEFEVSRHDSSTNEISRRAKVVTDFRAGKVGMPEGVCATMMTERALKCVCRKPCFSGDFPAVYKWLK